MRRWQLFDGTEFQPVSEHGPVLIDLHDCPRIGSVVSPRSVHLARAVARLSEVSAQLLLSHLRRMLTVSFGLQSPGLAQLLQPPDRELFFRRLRCRRAESLARADPPVALVRRHLGRPGDRQSGLAAVAQSAGWPSSRLGIEESLTHRQRERLQTCLLEQHIWRWCQSMGTDYACDGLPCSTRPGAGFQRPHRARWLVMATLAASAARAGASRRRADPAGAARPCAAPVAERSILRRGSARMASSSGKRFGAVIGGLLLLVLSGCSPVQAAQCADPGQHLRQNRGHCLWRRSSAETRCVCAASAAGRARRWWCFSTAAAGTAVRARLRLCRRSAGVAGNCRGGGGLSAVSAGALSAVSARTARGRWPGPRRTSASFPATRSACI